MSKPEEPETLVCVPVSKPEDKFILIGGTKIMLKDFIKYAADKYLALYIYEHDVPITEIFAQLHANNQHAELSKDNVRLQLLHYVYHHEVATFANFDGAVLERFSKNEFQNANLMQGVLNAQEFARWRMFKL